MWRICPNERSHQPLGSYHRHGKAFKDKLWAENFKHYDKSKEKLCLCSLNCDINVLTHWWLNLSYNGNKSRIEYLFFLKIVMPLLLQKITQKCANTNIHNANILIYNFQALPSCSADQKLPNLQLQVWQWEKTHDLWVLHREPHPHSLLI